MRTPLESKIGNTPLVRLTLTERAFKLSAALYAKAENTNLGGSIKDRVAQAILDKAEAEGRLTKGGLIVEATSGNTGIGLALVGALRGYKTVIVMPDSMSKRRRELIQKYGGELVLTDGKLGMQGAVDRALEIVNGTPNSILADQFNNPACVTAHYEGTGAEIWSQTDGKADIFVAGVGTGGTLTGVGKCLKERSKNVKIVAVEPKNSPLLSKGRAGAHRIQGIGANFIPSVLDREIYDEVLPIEDEVAIETAKFLREEENLYVGISSGANVAAAICLAKRSENAGKNIVTVLPDDWERYVDVHE